MCFKGLKGELKAKNNLLYKLSFFPFCYKQNYMNIP